jgi:hypothetical protein
MKFYILQDWHKPGSAAKESIVVHNFTQDGEMDNSARHEEVNLPANFYVILKSGLLTQRLDNKVNHYKELQYGNSDLRYYSEVRTSNKHNPVWGNISDFEIHFDVIPGLQRINKIVKKKYEVLAEEKSSSSSSSSSITRTYDYIDVPIHLIDNASYQSLEIACQEMNARDAILVGYSTYPGADACMFIAKDFAAVQQMLTLAATPGMDGLLRYKKWTWYFTRNLTALITYLIDVLAAKFHLETLKFVTTEQQEINSITYGQDLMSELANYFIICNVFGETGIELLYLIHSYLDERKASVCDLHITTNPTCENSDSLALSTNKAYVRSGLCGFKMVTQSPHLKKISSRRMDTVPEELQPFTIANVPKIIQQIYVLGPDNLYYISERNSELIPVIYNDITQTVAKLWLQLGNTETPVESSTSLLSSEDQIIITENTNHCRAYEDQLYYINKTEHICELLAVEGNKLLKFDEEMGISISNSVNRVLRLDELRKILIITRHDYHSYPRAVAESKADHEMKSDEIAVTPVKIDLPDKAEKIKNLFKKIEVNIALNRYKVFEKHMTHLLELGVTLDVVKRHMSANIESHGHRFFQAVSTNNKPKTLEIMHLFLNKFQIENKASSLNTLRPG